MDKKKSIRDIVIIILVVVVAVLIFKYQKGGGPADSAPNQPAQMGGETGSQMGDVSMPSHGSMQHGLSDGEPIIRLGNHVIGRDWFDETVEATENLLTGSDNPPENPLELAQREAIMRGCEFLTMKHLADEWGVAVEAAELDEREATFLAEETNVKMLEQTGISIKRQRNLWERELLEPKLKEHIAGIMGMDPTTEQAGFGYDQFIMSKKVNGQYEFLDESLKDVFETAKANAKAPGIGAPAGGMDMEGDGMMSPHGGEGTGDTGEQEEGSEPESEGA